jgi:hypothetical protein
VRRRAGRQPRMREAEGPARNKMIAVLGRGF